MMIFLQLYRQLNSLSKLLQQLEDEEFSKQISTLGKATVGGHTRHVIELMHCALDGYTTGVVDYINRERNLLLEADRSRALHALKELERLVEKPDRPLQLVTGPAEIGREITTISTTYFREVVYNTEHLIHHLALIKVAVIEMNLELTDDNFGVAESTINYRFSLNKH